MTGTSTRALQKKLIHSQNKQKSPIEKKSNGAKSPSENDNLILGYDPINVGLFVGGIVLFYYFMNRR